MTFDPQVEKRRESLEDFITRVTSQGEKLNCAWAKPTAIYTTPTSFETLQDYLHKSILVTALETLDLLPASKTRGVGNWTDQLYCTDPTRNDFPAPEGIKARSSSP